MVQLPRNLQYRLQRSDTAGPVLLAVLVGVLAAAWAIAFRWLIRGAQSVFLEQDGLLAALFPGDGVWSEVQILLAPAIGRLFVPQGKTRVRVGGRARSDDDLRARERVGVLDIGGVCRPLIRWARRRA